MRSPIKTLLNQPLNPKTSHNPQRVFEIKELHRQLIGQEDIDLKDVNLIKKKLNKCSFATLQQVIKSIWNDEAFDPSWFEGNENSYCIIYVDVLLKKWAGICDSSSICKMRARNKSEKATRKSFVLGFLDQFKNSFDDYDFDIKLKSAYPSLFKLNQ